MINTPMGYMTKQEAEMIGKLDKRSKPKRRPTGRRFYVPKTRVWRKTDEVSQKDKRARC